MIPINNSDTAWLIVADWNQENGKYYEELREDVLNPDINDWYFQWRLIKVGGDSFHVGYNIAIGGHDISLGCTVGCRRIGGGLGLHVGGNDPD